MTTAERLIKVNDGIEKTKELNAELEQTLYGTDTGGMSYYDILWDNLQQNGERTRYSGAFSWAGWNDKNYNPKYAIKPTDTSGIANLFFSNKEITDTKVSITATKNSGQAFANAEKIKRIPKLIFYNCSSIGNMFLNCYALEELYCEGTLDITGLNLKDSPNLNKASIESIISVLSNTTTGLSITLSQTAVNNAFTTDEWNALKATRANWDILLA